MSEREGETMAEETRRGDRKVSFLQLIAFWSGVCAATAGVAAVAGTGWALLAIGIFLMCLAMLSMVPKP